MNLYEKLDRLAHDGVCGYRSGRACDCGLLEVRVAVREVIDAASAHYSEVFIEYERDIPAHERLGRALAPFLNAKGEAAP